MTSADFLQFVVTTEFYSACKTSSGKSNHLHLIYLPYLHIEVRAVLDFVLCWKLVRFNMPYIRFLFVRPRLCLRLLSDSVSRRTPLSLANSSYCQVCSGLPPPSDLLMPSTQQKSLLPRKAGGGSTFRMKAVMQYVKKHRTETIQSYTLLLAFIRCLRSAPIRAVCLYAIK